MQLEIKQLEPVGIENGEQLFKDMSYPRRLSPLAVEHLARQIAFQD
jgi:hypothetical protein